MTRTNILAYLLAATFSISWFCPAVSAREQVVSNLEELIFLAQADGNEITMTPGTYSVRDYLTPEMLNAVGKNLGPGKRPPSPVLEFSGSDNSYNLEGVTLEVDTRIYDDISLAGYTRLLHVSGHRNKINGLTLRYVGPQKGTNGNALTLWGDGNELTDVSLFMHGSSPYGYGDHLGKGHSKLVDRLGKQSGLMVGGDNSILKRCKVISRAFGHCFYIQGAHNTVLEDCYAEGVHRSSIDMLSDTEGPAYDIGFKSVYENRDGRFMITPGYSKCLTEDGFRTYGSGGPRDQKTGKTTLINCTAVNTRAGFEIVGPTDAASKTELIGCTALGAERGFLLINGNIITRKCRGDVAHGPLLYLWRGANADVELELVGPTSDYTVHALATISGENHRVKITRWEAEGPIAPYPIMLGYAMPAHAEMQSPILAETTSNITLINETRSPVITSALNSPEYPSADAFTDPVK
ncbi:MAG: hypothetical protein ACSHYA_11960 [Opitutaceae bacterium]